MSRIGKQPVPLPAGVKARLEGEGGPRVTLHVEGPGGELEQDIHHMVNVAVEGGQILVTRRSETRQGRALHGLVRALAANMCEGVTTGFRKNLEVVGTGYAARIDGNRLMLAVGYSTDVVLTVPPGLEVKCPTVGQIEVKGIDKQLVGDFAARIRKARPPEPYKGKGIRYRGEVVRRKAGKTLAGK